MVVKDYLEERFEKIFSPHSYGYRPDKNAHQALESVRTNCRKADWIIDLDNKGYFDTISHDKLMLALKKHVPEIAGSKQAAALLGLSGLIEPEKANALQLSKDGVQRMSTFYGYYMLREMALAGNIQGDWVVCDLGHQPDPAYLVDMDEIGRAHV